MESRQLSNKELSMLLIKQGVPYLARQGINVIWLVAFAAVVLMVYTSMSGYTIQDVLGDYSAYVNEFMLSITAILAVDEQKGIRNGAAKILEGTAGIIKPKGEPTKEGEQQVSREGTTTPSGLPV